ncbi:hypothetical protein DTO166G4_8675 [Paecilomyces variotii]|nr:hypothetical protein DTO166G4_8675 [Paecilomyces variotii]KAJ9228754.1 hypothetical protein DTO166G5_8352 [Paecilomyces variotii]
MAKRMGLHVRNTAESFKAPEEWSKEEMERLSVLWASLWLDRRLAVLEGRECHIDRRDVSAPMPLSLMEGTGFLDRPLSVELIYACSIEFFCLQDVALNRLYGFPDNITKDDAISDGHMKFITWFASLPTSMKNIPAGKGFHPSFLAFHLSFHAGLILLHRRSLGDDGQAAKLSNQRCEESAATITSLLRSYHENFPCTIVDPMVLHAAFTSALVHLSLLLKPDVVAYRSSLQALRTMKRILLTYTRRSPHASTILEDLRDFATRWDISPVNSLNFWIASGDDADTSSRFGSIEP